MIRIFIIPPIYQTIIGIREANKRAKAARGSITFKQVFCTVFVVGILFLIIWLFGSDTLGQNPQLM